VRCCQTGRPARSPDCRTHSNVIPEDRRLNQQHAEARPTEAHAEQKVNRRWNRQTVYAPGMSAAYAARPRLAPTSDYRACSDRETQPPQRRDLLRGGVHRRSDRPAPAGLARAGWQRQVPHDSNEGCNSRHLRAVVEHAVWPPSRCLAVRPSEPRHTAGKLHS
jgi:hypothetical protein